MSKYIAVDMGASSGRVLVGNIDSFEIVRRFESKKIFKNESIFWDIDFIFKEICLGIKKAIELYPGQISSIGIDTWGADYCLLDSNDELLSMPFCYRDDRTSQSKDIVHQIISEEELYKKTGIQIIQFNTIYQLKADQIERQEILNKAKILLFIPDYLNFLLCGVKGSELTEASTTALLEPFSQQWNNELMTQFDFPIHLFQKIVRPGTVLGTLKPEIGGASGERIKIVAIGSHDTASAVASVPSIKDSGNLFISSGTWSLLGIETDKPVINDYCYENNFTNEICIDGRIRLIKNIMGMWLLQEVKKGYDSDGLNMTWDELSEDAKKSPIPSVLLDPNDEVFYAPHTIKNTMISRIQEWHKRKGCTVPKTHGEIVQSIFYGLANAYSEYINRIEEIGNTKYDAVHIVGGGSSDTYLCQLTANISGKKVVAGPKEATSLGNLIVQQVTDGALLNFHEGRRIIKDNYDLNIYLPQCR